MVFWNSFAIRSDFESIKYSAFLREGRGIAVNFDSGLLFDVDSSNLRTEGYENLQKLANILKKDNETILMIVGHTDSTGD